MRAYSPIPFVDVRITGQFWRERLETVLTRTIPSQHVKLGEHGILNSLKLPKPVPPLAHSRATATISPCRCSGTPTSASGSRRRLCAVAPARCGHRSQDRRHRRRSRAGAVAGRLSQLLVHRARAREALDQSARQPRALQCRPHARRRDRLFPRHRPAPAARHHGALCRSCRADVSAAVRARSAAIAAIRRSSSR